MDDFIVDYCPNPDFPRTPDLSTYAALEKVPFFFLLAEGGEHTAVGFDGNVSEMHWDEPGDNPQAMTEVPLKNWYTDHDGSRRTQWSDGVIAIPPGVWEAAKTAAAQSPPPAGDPPPSTPPSP